MRSHAFPQAFLASLFSTGPHRYSALSPQAQVTQVEDVHTSCCSKEVGPVGDGIFYSLGFVLGDNKLPPLQALRSLYCFKPLLALPHRWTKQSTGASCRQTK